VTNTQPIESVRDAFDPRLVRDADGALGELNRAGVLDAADVQVARTVGRLGAESDESVLLAVALAVRAVRLGSSCVDLGDVAAELRSAAPEVQVPSYVDDVESWLARILAGSLPTGKDRVLVVEPPLLYLTRYHALETSLCDRLVARLGQAPPVVDDSRLETDLDRLFGTSDSPDRGFAEQQDAADRAARSWVSLITGGPGTGKTTTIARLLAALRSQRAADSGGRQLNVGLAAPTGKAAARMREALAQAASAEVFTADEREWLRSLEAVTLHRLLGPRPDHRTAFRHHAGQKLPYDVVIVDETSMVSLLMMERLVQAVPSACRLVLVGDPDQLASVEAGAVLRDVVEGLGGAESPWVTRLTHGHRFAGAIGELAEAIVSGDADRALAVLDSGADDVRLTPPDEIEDVIDGRPRAQARAIARAAADGDVTAALDRLAEHRLLCAHRDGPAGIERWNDRLEREVRRFPDPQRPWYVGRPVLITRNDRAVQVNNGDVGVVVDDHGRLTAHLDTGTIVAATRLAAVQSAYASTVHRGQGSEFDHVTLLLPEEDSPLLSRELLYTAVTRARSSLTIVGTTEIIRGAIERPTARASGIERRLRAGEAPA